MVYAWFTFWLFLVIFAGSGVYSLLGRLTRPMIVSWVLLPGTIVSEMAYIFGCLITGGEIRKAKMMPEEGGKGGDGGTPTTEAAPKHKTIGPIVASIISIVAVGAVLVLMAKLLSEANGVRAAGVDAVSAFVSGDAKMELPGNGGGPEFKHGSLSAVLNSFWKQVGHQVELLQRMTHTLENLNWRNWRVPVFVYLCICLSVRLSPATRPLRPTLAAVVVIAAVIAGIGLIWKDFGNRLMDNIWPLLTYVWTTLLLLLVVTLIISGLAALAKALMGKGGKAAPKTAKA